MAALALASPEPEPEGLIALSEDDRQALSKRLKAMFGLAETSKDSIKERWERNRELYHDNPNKAVSNKVMNYPMVHYPLVSPRMDTLTDTVLGTVFSQNPVFRPDSAGPAEETEKAERIMDYFVKYCKLEEKARKSSPIAGYTNCAINRIIFDPIKAAPHIDVMEPTEFLFFDPNIHELDDAPLVGHKYTRTAPEVRQLQAQGKFYEGLKLKVKPSETKESRKGPNERLEEVSPVYEGDKAVDFYECVCLLNLDDIAESDLASLESKPKKEADWERYLVTFAVDTFEVCAVERYGLSTPNYATIGYLVPQPGNFWTSYSFCHKLQGLQEQYNHLNNMLVYGSYMACFPPIARMSALGAMKNQKYGAGDIVDMAMANAATPLAIRFDPGQLPFMVQAIDRMADATSGVTQASQGVQFGDKRTLGENQIVQAGGNVRMGGYIQQFTGGLERDVSIMAEILVATEKEWGPVHGASISGYQMGDGQLLAKSKCWQAQGRTPDQSPQAMLQKMQMLLEIAQTVGPQPDAMEQGLVMAIAQTLAQVTQALGLQVPPEALMPAAQQAAQMALQQVEGPIDVMEIIRTIVNLTNAPNQAQILREDDKNGQQPNALPARNPIQQPGMEGTPSPFQASQGPQPPAFEGPGPGGESYLNQQNSG